MSQCLWTIDLTASAGDLDARQAALPKQFSPVARLWRTGFSQQCNAQKKISAGVMLASSVDGTTRAAALHPMIDP
jgi:hypothetical protein